MKTKSLIWLYIAILQLISIASAENESGEIIDDYLHSGNLQLRAGSAISIYEYSDAEKPGPGIGFGFISTKYDTAPDKHLQFGIWWIAVKEIWERHEHDYDTIYTQDSDLRQIYGKLKVPNTKTSIQAGRFGIKMATLAGDSHQAAEIISADIPNLILRGIVINRWIDKSRTDMFYKGITGWENANTTHEKAGDEYWMGSAKILLGEENHIEPFASYQEKVMLVYGANAKFSHKLTEETKIGMNTILALYGNETPREIQPDYKDVFSWLVRGSYSLKQATIGLGWFGIQNKKADLAAGLFDRFDPLMEDLTVPYNDNNGANLIFTDLEIKIDRIKAVIMYGYGTNKIIDTKSHEMDITLYYNITDNLELGVFAALNKYTEKAFSDYIKTGMSITLFY